MKTISKTAAKTETAAKPETKQEKKMKTISKTAAKTETAAKPETAAKTETAVKPETNPVININPDEFIVSGNSNQPNQKAFIALVKDNRSGLAYLYTGLYNTKTMSFSQVGVHDGKDSAEQKRCVIEGIIKTFINLLGRNYSRKEYDLWLIPVRTKIKFYKEPFASKWYQEFHNYLNNEETNSFTHQITLQLTEEQVWNIRQAEVEEIRERVYRQIFD